MTTKRQQAIARSLRTMAPLIPFADAQEVLALARGGTLKELTPNVAIWLALTSHVRHRHTPYDELLREGYERDAARHFVVEDMERQLAEWGCTRPILDGLDDEAGAGA